MYASRAICSRCASQLRPAQARQLGAAALFSALSESANSAAAQGRENEDGNRRGASIGRGGHRKPFSQRQHSPKRSEDSAVALFNDVVKPGSGNRSPRKPRSSSLSEWEIAAKMKELTEKNVPATDKLRLFQTEIWPHLREHRGLPKHLSVSTNHFMSDICDEMARNGSTGRSVALSHICGKIGKWDLDIRNQLVLNICHALLYQKQPSASHDHLMKELIDMWKHISQLRRMSTRQNASSQFVFPSIDEVLKDIGQPSGTHMHPTAKALTSIFLQFHPDQARDIVPGLLATIAILSDTRYTKQSIQMEAAPLLNLVAAALKNDGAVESFISSTFDDRVRFPKLKLEELRAYVTSQWPAATEMLYKHDASWRQGLVSSSGSSSTPVGMMERLHKQLRAAYQTRNIGAVLGLWQDVKGRLEEHPNLAQQLRNDTEFLDEWIFVWCAIRKGDRVQETLDLMQRLQVRPTIRTYTNMMHGWKICKDTEKIEALWGKLVDSGVKLDAFIWTERISSLIEAGKPQAGIQALAEMQALWKSAVKKEVPHTAIQPNIEVVNATFKGLITLDRRAAFEVLEWAGREQIEPNVRTFNILLRESFRNDSTDDVQSLLKSMNKRGIDPDEATFTIILEEVLGSMSGASASEQVQAVHYVFDEMKTAGLRPNMQTYGKMLYAVAELATGADETIDAVLKHMRDDGISVTPHMVTILIERAMNRDPHNISAVHGLLKEHGFKEIGQGDQTLWERVMSAHAIAGDTTGGMAIFNDLAQAGRPVTSLSCLTDILRALIMVNQHDEARSVVSVVLNHKTKNREASNDGRYWRHHFWFMAKDNGLLNPDDLPPQLRSEARG
ncbi:Pentatricopeptide repeat-containing CRP1-like protein [Cladobotryum mycophilum]|uniref:Pentatricopeptide repeat-containing CRP1-like protein n=1 Tax=Cladobotryum mycophilum TaxID=491253 RepID=A0ABR0SZN1_9HYPO